MELFIITGEDIVEILSGYAFTVMSGAYAAEEMIKYAQIKSNSSAIAAKINEKILPLIIENARLKVQLEVLESVKQTRCCQKEKK